MKAALENDEGTKPAPNNRTHKLPGMAAKNDVTFIFFIFSKALA